MKEFSRLFLFPILMAFGVLTASAQSTNWYYDQSTRYGTFRHYSNGGSKLISGIDYAAGIAISQQEAKQMTADRERQRQIEYERMRQAQYPKANASQNAPAISNGPTPAELTRQQQVKAEARYRENEQRLEQAENTDVQWLILNEMQRHRPNDATVLRMIAIAAHRGNADLVERLSKDLSDASEAANREAVEAASGSAYFRTMKWESALRHLGRLQTQDLNSTAEILCSRLRLNQWNELKTGLQRGSAAFPELSPLADHLSAAIAAMEQGERDTTKTAVTAAALHRFAVMRRESRRIDCVNILALDAAVRLAPENATYREERFNSNAFLQLKQAMEEDFQFFNK